MIIEGILTTMDTDETARASPMGAVLSEAQKQLELRPFTSSTSYQNLLQRPHGVFHLTDDPMLFAQAVTKRWSEPPAFVRAQTISGWVIPNAYRWFEFEVVYVDRSGNRANVQCLIVDQGVGPPFGGACRAKNSIIEASVAVSRIHLLPPEEIAATLSNAERICKKTGGEQENFALRILMEHVSRFHQEIHSFEENEMSSPIEFRDDRK